MNDLLKSRLANVQIGIPPEMARAHFLMRTIVGYVRARTHTKTSCLAVNTMLAKIETNCPDKDGDIGAAGVLGKMRLEAGGSSFACRGHACIQANNPCRMKRANPHVPPADHVPLKTTRRRSSYRGIQLSPATDATPVLPVAPFLPSAPMHARCCGDAPTAAIASESSLPVDPLANCCRRNAWSR